MEVGEYNNMVLFVSDNAGILFIKSLLEPLGPLGDSLSRMIVQAHQPIVSVIIRGKEDIDYD